LRWIGRFGGLFRGENGGFEGGNGRFRGKNIDFEGVYFDLFVGSKGVVGFIADSCLAEEKHIVQGGHAELDVVA